MTTIVQHLTYRIWDGGSLREPHMPKKFHRRHRRGRENSSRCVWREQTAMSVHEVEDAVLELMIESNCTQEAYNIEFEAIEGYAEEIIAWQVHVKNIRETDALGQKDNHSLVTSSSQDSVPAVFWRVDGLAAFPQPIQENP
ncbi:hypothetical protein TNCV_2590361 [Trichonephila clavipes]|nr:hypothetical protein TNCV_2590361 [Trichonephila clavipes]